MADLPPRVFFREVALHTATNLHGYRGNPPEPIGEILRTATEIYDWLARPVQLTLTFGPIIDAPGAALTSGDTPMSNIELGDNQSVVATVVPDDAADQATTDTLTWTASVETAVSLTPSADTLSCVIDGLVPTEGVVITATDANGLTVSGTVDVIAGAAASLNLTFGAVSTVTPPATDGSGTGATGDAGEAPAAPAV